MTFGAIVAIFFLEFDREVLSIVGYVGGPTVIGFFASEYFQCCVIEQIDGRVDYVCTSILRGSVR